VPHVPFVFNRTIDSILRPALGGGRVSVHSVCQPRFARATAEAWDIRA
jgi:hypothetical protein